MTKTTDKPVALEQRETHGEKLFSPSTARNLGPITGLLDTILPPDARVLEIGSGTGEHGEGLCQLRRDITWQYSDPHPPSRASQAARVVESPDQLLKPLDLDLTRSDWAQGLTGFHALVCINVIHISPWRVAMALADFAAQALPADGLVYLYGPYKRGADTAPSNLDFDQSLKSRNPDWGVRELEQVRTLFETAGLIPDQQVEMPANNLSLVFRRPA